MALRTNYGFQSHFQFQSHLKHFPGDGVDNRDQHLHATYNTLTLEEWEASYGKMRAASAYCYELPEHPEFLREISRYTKLGVDEIREAKDVNWTVVCPSSFFDPEGELTGNYRVSDEGHLLYNEKGVSRVTYEDLASAMLDIAEQNSFCCMLVTVLTN